MHKQEGKLLGIRRLQKKVISLLINLLLFYLYFNYFHTFSITNISFKEIHGSTSIGSGKDCTSIEITNGPIMHKSNIKNIGTNTTYNFVTVSQ